MIGGHDFVLPGTPQDGDLWFVLLAIRAAWPGAVFHGNEEPRRTRPVGGPEDVASAGRELFVYRDVVAEVSWKREGPTEGNDPAMIHVVVGEDSLTLVADAEGSETGCLCEEILVALRKDRLVGRRPRLAGACGGLEQIVIAAKANCDICKEAGHDLPTLAHLRDKCPASFLWASDIELLLEILRVESRRRVETFQTVSGRCAEEMSEIDKARVLDLVQLAASTHADFVDLPEKVRAHFLFLDLLKEG